jgi:hypothetical protein
VHGNIDGDVDWPALDERHGAWSNVSRIPPDERHAWPMTFEVWERR